MVQMKTGSLIMNDYVTTYLRANSLRYQNGIYCTPVKVIYERQRRNACEGRMNSCIADDSLSPVL
jgi:hypothetical protein